MWISLYVLLLVPSKEILTEFPQIRNDEEATSTATVLVATGDNFESANAAVMYQARNLVVTGKKSSGEYDAEMAALRDGVKPEWYENWYDGLGFCRCSSTNLTVSQLTTLQRHMECLGSETDRGQGPPGCGHSSRSQHQYHQSDY